MFTWKDYTLLWTHLTSLPTRDSCRLPLNIISPFPVWPLRTQGSRPCPTSGGVGQVWRSVFTVQRETERSLQCHVPGDLARAQVSGLHPLSFASLVLAPLWRFWRHLLTSKVLRICLIRTWPYSLLKWNRRDRLIILLHVLWQTYIFLIKHFPNRSNPLRRKSSFIRSFPKGVREKDFSKETKQRGCVCGEGGWQRAFKRGFLAEVEIGMFQGCWVWTVNPIRSCLFFFLLFLSSFYHALSFLISAANADISLPGVWHKCST